MFLGAKVCGVHMQRALLLSLLEETICNADVAAVESVPLRGAITEAPHHAVVTRTPGSPILVTYGNCMYLARCE